jgi:hypothetical protein
LVTFCVGTAFLTEGKIEGRRGIRCRQLLYILKERRGYCELKEEAPDLTLQENSLCKRLWTSHKTDYKMNTYSSVVMILVIMAWINPI